MITQEELSAYGQRFWEKRKPLLKEAGEKADRLLAGCSQEETLYFTYILATLPLSDLLDYDLELFLDMVREALAVRQEFSWCRDLPEHLFLLDVLYPRINTEELSGCRGIFYRSLAGRVRGLTLDSAILEVNRWCAEHVTYRSTDDRTASSLAVYRCGYGRCGEESTFAVNALRSVGIAARQVYAPWWSHCDDNHAWVDVYDGESWRYLGACEPEPELDRGWFTGAASRAMMIHARAFAQGGPEDWGFLFPETEPLDLWEENGVIYENVTRRYGETRPVTVLVTGKDGRPAAGAEISFSILNMARFSKIAVLKTGPDGTAKMRLGLGNVRITAVLKGEEGETLLDTARQDFVRVKLQTPDFPSWKQAVWREFDFLAPDGRKEYPAPLSSEQRERRRAWLDRAEELRKAWIESPENSGGLPLAGPLARVWETLTEKDRAEAPRTAVLEDCLGAYSWEEQFPREVFETALLCPRIGLEPLTPWRERLANSFSPEEKERFRSDPKKVWDCLEERLAPADAYPALYGTPIGAFQGRAANGPGKKLLFCAVCRSVDIPARLSPIDGEPEYWDGRAFSPIAGEKSARLMLKAGPGAALGQSFSLARLEGAREVPLTLDDGVAEGEPLPLRPGKYRAVTATRLPNGKQLARRLDFSVKAGEVCELSLSFREGTVEDLLVSRSLPPFVLADRDSGELPGLELLGANPLSLVVWLEVGREPTEHILNELRETAKEFSASGCAIHLVLERWEQEEDPALRRTREQLPGARIWQGSFGDCVPELARCMFADPDKLPLVLLADSKGNGLYCSAGYNVGTAALLLRLIRQAQSD